MEKEKTKKNSSWSWSVDESDLKSQVENYESFKITESYRGISVLIVLALLAFSLLLSFLGVYASVETMIWGLVIYLPILFFVFKGHRWAIIALMVLWTFEKGYSLYEIVDSGSGSPIMAIIWWLIIMPYFWKALKVENERRKVLTPSAQVVGGSTFCHECGERVNTNSKFCQKCGAKVLSSN